MQYYDFIDIVRSYLNSAISMILDAEAIKRENAEMRRMMVCKSCNNANVTRVLIGCNHAMCTACTQTKNKCFHCGSVIRKVHPVKFESSPQ
jgi:hypothetical protein